MAASASRSRVRGVPPRRTVKPRPVMAVTSGEPAGIGPDVCLQLAGAALPARIVLIGDRAVLAARAAALRLDVALTQFAHDALPTRGALEVLHVPALLPVVPGRLEPRNSRYVVAIL